MDSDMRDKQLPVFLGIENNQLSMKHTFFWKYSFMPIWILSFGLVVMVCSWDRSSESWDSVLFVPWFLGSIYAYFVFGRIKKVSLAGSKLVISNYRKEIEVDISEIDSAGGSVLLNPELVWLKLKTDTGFGRKIIFAPEQRSPLDFFTGVTKHPLVAKINSLKEFQGWE